jgi:protein-S-isoprenylcysteine O-methyltransferase Ste14
MNPNRLSAVGLIVLIGCILALIFREAFFGTEPVAIAIQAAAIALMLWARLTFGLRSFHATAKPTEGGLITRGPYKYFRHPIYSAVLYFTWASLIDHFSAWNAALVILATGMLALRMASEEKLLVRRYPEYAEYSRKTRRVIPFVL